MSHKQSYGTDTFYIFIKRKISTGCGHDFYLYKWGCTVCLLYRPTVKYTLINIPKKQKYELYDNFGMQDKIYIPQQKKRQRQTHQSRKHDCFPFGSNTVVNNWWTILNPRGELEYDKQIYARVSFCRARAIINSASLPEPLGASLNPVSLFARHVARPVTLLSARTFTFLVLLGNKRGGMSGGPYHPG